MSTSFEILMNQLGMPLEMRESGAFEGAEIQEVIVHKLSRVWEFCFVFCRNSSHHDFSGAQKPLG